jgi:hypothetical protein
VTYDKRSCVALLLLEGADDTIKNNVDETPFELARHSDLKRPYGVRDAWEGMKTNSSRSAVESILSCVAMVTTYPPLVTNPAAPLAAFLTEVPEANDYREMIGLELMLQAWSSSSCSVYSS